MRLAAEVELDDRVLLRSRAKTGLKLRRVRAKYWHAAIGRLMKSQRQNWKKSDTFIRVWHELAGDSVTAHWLVRTLDENEVARMLFRKGRSKGRRTLWFA